VTITKQSCLGEDVQKVQRGCIDFIALIIKSSLFASTSLSETAVSSGSTIRCYDDLLAYVLNILTSEENIKAFYSLSSSSSSSFKVHTDLCLWNMSNLLVPTQAETQVRICALNALITTVKMMTPQPSVNPSPAVPLSPTSSQTAMLLSLAHKILPRFASTFFKIDSWISSALSLPSISFKALYVHLFFTFAVSLKEVYAILLFRQIFALTWIFFSGYDAVCSRLLWCRYASFVFNSILIFRTSPLTKCAGNEE